MFVLVSQDYSSICLRDAEDMKRFSVQIESAAEDLQRIRAAVSHVGELVDQETMWVNETWLRHAPGRVDGPQWQEGISAMIETAKKYGWIDDKTHAIRAHVVWTASVA